MRRSKVFKIFSSFYDCRKNSRDFKRYYADFLDNIDEFRHDNVECCCSKPLFEESWNLKETMNLQIFFPTSLVKEFKMTVDDVEIKMGKSFTLKKKSKVKFNQISITQQECDGHSDSTVFPVLWIFQNDKTFFVKTTFGKYIKPMKLIKKLRQWGGVTFRPFSCSNHLPMHHFSHHYTFDLILSMLWYTYKKKEIEKLSHFNRALTRFDKSGKFRGSFFKVSRDEEYFSIINYTNEPVDLIYFGPKESGFNEITLKKRIKLGPYEEAYWIKLKIPKKVPQLLLALGKHWMEWFPIYDE